MKKFEKWNVAFRRRKPNTTLIDDTKTPFIIIPNTWRYWCADPHLIEFNDNTYVFAELYDRVLRRGVIGYCTINGNTASKWKIALSTPFHLSYPNIFYIDSDVYMIPESYVAKEISVYKAINFPNKWKKVKTLKKDIITVDTTPLCADGENYLLSYLLNDNGDSLQLFKSHNGDLQDCFTIKDAEKQLRPAGNFFKVDNILYRPAQDCKNGYGCALNFYSVNNISHNNYSETLFKKITPQMITTNSGIIAKGIHTYNFNDKYEVIDIKGYEFDALAYIMRPIWYIKRRLTKIFSKE
ncbi:MAG: hypothetical protein IKT44_03805 [Clostridia bacterium]|nr:hypothetical protein [Clostridia bacterium]